MDDIQLSPIRFIVRGYQLGAISIIDVIESKVVDTTILISTTDKSAYREKWKFIMDNIDKSIFKLRVGYWRHNIEYMEFESIKFAIEFK